MPVFTSADGVRLHYTDTLEGSGPPVLCLAGLTRALEDFDHLLPHLAGRRVIRLDSRGRGGSDPAPDPATYTIAREAQDAVALLDHLGIARAAIVGTSRGGLIALVLAAGADRDRLAAVVLNDIGPVIGAEGLARLLRELGDEPEPRTMEEAASILAARSARDFPGVPMQRWRAEAGARWQEGPDGLRRRYDPAILTSLARQAAAQAGAAPPDLWAAFEALSGVPVGVIRGANSDLLLPDTVVEMADRHPALAIGTVPDRGHVPFLDEPEALAVIDAVLP